VWFALDLTGAMISGQSLHVKSLFTQLNGGCPVATIVLEIPESCKPIAETVTALVETLEKLTVPGRRQRDFSEIENQIAAKVAQVECAAVGAGPGQPRCDDAPAVGRNRRRGRR
jgi:hypothetical protein